ncbi:MAG: hypothetical protein AB7O37_19400 [Vicinamibacteria bacterium]
MGSTGREFVGHWEWAAGKGLLNANTANALRAACTKVLEIEKGWEALDISTVDVDGLLRRFRTLKGREYKPDSLKEYERRFRKAHASYLGYLKDPSSWKIGGQERPPRNGKLERGRPGAESAEEVEKATLPPTVGFVEYPFPLREGRIARMSLPTDLKSADVRRLSAFLATLVVDQDAAEA